MRVYEIARKLGISVGEVIEKLKAHGVAVKGHLSQVSEEAVSFLQSNLDRAGKTKGSAEPIEPIVLRPVALDALAVALHKRPADVILLLLGWGIPVTKNQVLSVELIKRIAKEYEVECVSPPASTVLQEQLVDDPTEIGETIERAPVVVILGHVDHGKTTLLDFIRKSRIAAKEHGGITQHLGAYEVIFPYEGKEKPLVFLDTPGHAAFAKMRQRGVAAADIAIILIAADDGVMPQTIEAIKAARSVDMPILVALNKIDRVEPAQVEKVKQSLAQHDLLIEEWGGEIICAPLSAKSGEGVDHLLEMILLRAEVMDLRASKDIDARGYVLESKIEKGRGIVATIILRHGSLSVGDHFMSGDVFGVVSSLVDSHGKRLKTIHPSTPVQVAGFQEASQPGDMFRVISKQEYKRARPVKRGPSRLPVEQQSFVEGGSNLILKADSNLSLESLSDAIFRIKGAKECFNVVASSIGMVSEGDVELASNTGSSIIGLHVKVDQAVGALAKRLEVPLHLKDIIYRLLEGLEKEIAKRGTAEAEMISIGEATVLKVFNIKGVGVIAGSRIDEGRFVSDGTVVILRNNKQIGKGKIVSLQRERKTVKEVHEGSECGFVVEGFTGWKPGDRAECLIPKG